MSVAAKDKGQMVKLLAVIQGAAYGGAHNQVVQLHETLSSDGFETVVLMTDEPGNAALRLRASGVPVRLARLRRIRASKPIASLTYIAMFWSQVSLIRSQIRETGASIVQAHGITNIDVAVAARLEQAALVWQILDTRAPKILRTLLTPAVVALSDVILVTGTSILKFYPGLTRAKDRIVPYFPPVAHRSEEDVAESRRKARAVMAIHEDVALVGCLANFNPQKGQDRLIRAFAKTQAIAFGDRVELLLRGATAPGHDRYRHRLDRLARGLGLSPRTVESLPDDMSAEDFVASLDVFALSAVGRSEGTPTVIIEAMLAGIPIITTAAGGVVDLVRNGVEGIVVDVDDAGAMATAIDKLVADGALRAQMSKAARSRATSELSIARCLSKYRSAYASALARRNGRYAVVK